MRAHLQEDPPKPSEHGLPTPLDPVVATALAKLPDERYRSASRFIDAARAALAGEDTERISTDPPPPPQPLAPTVVAVSPVPARTVALPASAGISRTLIPFGFLAIVLIGGSLIAGAALFGPAAPPTPTPTIASSMFSPTTAPTTAAPIVATAPPTPPPTPPPSAQADASVAVAVPELLPAPAAPPAALTRPPFVIPTTPPTQPPSALAVPGSIRTGETIGFQLSHFPPSIDLVLTITDSTGRVRQSSITSIGANGAQVTVPLFSTKTTDPAGAYVATFQNGGLVVTVVFQVL